MKISVLTIFPEMVESLGDWGVLSRAVDQKIVDLKIVNIRDFTRDKHRMTDDYPFGGGTGLVMKADPILDALDSVRGNKRDCHIVLTSPSGEIFNNEKAIELSEYSHVVFVCGRYKGVDERVMEIIDEELSIGDFVLSGGELAAMVMIDALSRFVPGVVGDMDSVMSDSFAKGFLDHPHYTRPREVRNKRVPEVIVSGDHERVDLFRRKESILKTAIRRPDLFLKAEFTLSDKKAVLELLRERSHDVE
ncbi:MAG TPA: tRNA (guanosine(37)-N1)-methyltransferase TrmD [Kosmotogaceae bacterium]|nr:tRNA (guanosine(37)-N1)-methyltransferase TrmD [Kosmotogaceae bacterium]